MHNFEPRGQVTGIGSLPLLDGDEAVRFVARYSPRIPFLPELPQRCANEESIPRVLAPVTDLLTRQHAGRFDVLPGKLDVFLQRWAATPSEGDWLHSAAFPHFKQALARGDFPDALAVKTQMSGPMTLAYSLHTGGRSFADQTQFHQPLLDYLLRLARWQIDQLSGYGLPVLLFLDEPCLFFHDQSVNGSRLVYLLDQMIRLLRRTTNARIGVHACAHGVIEPLLALQPDIVSLDAHIELENLLSLPSARMFIDAGGSIALGAVPTWPDLSAFDPTAFLIRLALAVPDQRFLEQLARQSFITATCEVGLLSQDAAQQSFETAASLHGLFSRIVTL